MNYKLWLKISSILLALFLLAWSFSVPPGSQVSFLGWIIGGFIGSAISFVVLYPVFYYAWRKKN